MTARTEMKSTHRIFLKTNTEIRDFLWLNLGSACKFNHGSKGLASANKDDALGTLVNPSSTDMGSDSIVFPVVTYP